MTEKVRNSSCPHPCHLFGDSSNDLQRSLSLMASWGNDPSRCPGPASWGLKIQIQALLYVSYSQILNKAPLPPFGGGVAGPWKPHSQSRLLCTKNHWSLSSMQKNPFEKVCTNVCILTCPSFLKIEFPKVTVTGADHFTAPKWKGPTLFAHLQNDIIQVWTISLFQFKQALHHL